MYCRRITVVLAGCLLVASCTTGTKQFVYNEYDPSDARLGAVRRVAIVPNRLPLNLTDPEKWRRHNWTVAAEEFGRAGFQVIDYETSKRAFEQSGLPVEDTMSSRDKFAALADDLGVDIVIVPYYGTFLEFSNFLLFFGYKWSATVTFQIYRRDVNDFESRVDMVGHDRYISGLLTVASIAVGFVNSEAALVCALAGMVSDLVNTSFRGPDTHYRADFKRAIRDGLKPYLYSLRRSTSARPATPPVSPSTTQQQERVECAACGAYNEPGSNFCVGCGARLGEAPTSERAMKECPSCRARNDPDAKYCIKCGVRLP